MAAACLFVGLLGAIAPGAFFADGVAVAATENAAVQSEPGFAARAISWIFEQQRAFHRELIERLNTLSRDGGALAALSLIAAGFLYGIFHAAGPGHGKAVIATYLITQREAMRRGVWLAVASAFLQGLVALALVYGLIYAAAWVPRDSQGAVTWSERVSFALVALVGAFLVLRAARGVVRRFWPAGDATGHAHDADGCGHSHVPSPGQVGRARDWRATLGVILSVGLRPCSGAVIILVLAQALALPWYGAAAVFAMSAGTAITVSALAFVAVNARGLAARVAMPLSRRLVVGPNLVALLGGGILIWLGINLLIVSFRPAHPLGL